MSVALLAWLALSLPIGVAIGSAIHRMGGQP